MRLGGIIVKLNRLKLGPLVHPSLSGLIIGPTLCGLGGADFLIPLTRKNLPIMAQTAKTAAGEESVQGRASLLFRLSINLENHHRVTAYFVLALSSSAFPSQTAHRRSYSVLPIKRSSLRDFPFVISPATPATMRDASLTAMMAKSSISSPDTQVTVNPGSYCVMLAARTGQEASVRSAR